MRSAIVYVVLGLGCVSLLACSSTDDAGAGADASSSPVHTDSGATDVDEPDGLPSSDAPETPDVAPVADISGPATDALEAPDVSEAADTSVTPDADLFVDSAADTAIDTHTVDQLGPDAAAAVDVVEVGPEVALEADADEPGLPDGVTGAPDDLWLFSVHAATKTLLKVDVETGAAEAWCDLPDTMTNYPSLTFDRNNQLLASRAAKPWGLDLIDPCTCSVTSIGQYGTFTEVNGITASHGFDLFGIASAGNQLISISSQTAATTAVGVLGANFTTGGATWSDDVDALYAINGGDDSLYTIDPDTAATLDVISLDHDFGTVGMERHPLNGVLYACSTAGDLLDVDPDTGAVEVIGALGWEGACTNLAAPFQAVTCVDGE